MAGKLFKGMLIGAVAGAIVGVLYAPRKGSKTRKKLAKKGSGLSETLKTEFSSLEKKMNNKYSSIKEDTAELLEQGKERLQDAR